MFVDPYRDVSNEELEEMLDDAESKQSDLEEAIDELESNMPSEDDPEYADAVKKLEELKAELEEVEDEIDNIEDEISEREDEDEDDDE